MQIGFAFKSRESAAAVTDLTRAGHAVSTYQTGRALLEAHRRARFDVIIVEYDLGGTVISGLDVRARLADDEVVVIVMANSPNIGRRVQQERGRYVQIGNNERLLTEVGRIAADLQRQ